jgi:hypothetical protein
MSIVTDFVKAMHGQAAPMIGQENVFIGSTTLSCTLAEISDTREFTETGYSPGRSLTAVCLLSALPSTSILQRAATARGEDFRVVSVSKGAVFATITLESATKA